MPNQLSRQAFRRYGKTVLPMLPQHRRARAVNMKVNGSSICDRARLFKRNSTSAASSRASFQKKIRSARCPSSSTSRHFASATMAGRAGRQRRRLGKASRRVFSLGTSQMDQKTMPACFARRGAPRLGRAPLPGTDITRAQIVGYSQTARDQTGAADHFAPGQKELEQGQQNAAQSNTAKTQFKPGKRPYNRGHSESERIWSGYVRDQGRPSKFPHTGHRPIVQKHRLPMETATRHDSARIMCCKCLSADRTIAIRSNWEAGAARLALRRNGKSGRTNYDAAPDALKADESSRSPKLEHAGRATFNSNLNQEDIHRSENRKKESAPAKLISIERGDFLKRLLARFFRGNSHAAGNFGASACTTYPTQKAAPHGHRLARSCRGNKPPVRHAILQVTCPTACLFRFIDRYHTTSHQKSQDSKSAT